VFIEMMDRSCIRIDPKERKKVDKLCGILGWTQSEFIREALKEYLEKKTDEVLKKR